MYVEIKFGLKIFRDCGKIKFQKREENQVLTEKISVCLVRNLRGFFTPTQLFSESQHTTQ